jgi:lipoprotein signal peptidase
MQAARGTPLSQPEGTGEQPGLAGRTSPSRRIYLFAVVAGVVYAADVASKILVVADLSDHEPISMLGGLLTLRLTRNPGAAFSTATGYTVLLTLVAIGVVICVTRLATRLGSAVWAVALGLLLGGALGNLTDRMFRSPGPLRGHVVDFLELPHWPIFNLADSAIVLGAVLITVQSVRGIHLDGRRS